MTHFDLERFRGAQDGGVHERALAELRVGAKRSHWIWYVLPQLRGLGSSSPSIRFGLAGPDEAEAYLRDDLLRERLVAVIAAVHEQVCARGVPLHDLMGSRVDAVKCVSSLTLFGAVAARLAGDSPSGTLASIASMANETLARAALQGYPHCAFTVAALSGSTSPRSDDP